SPAKTSLHKRKTLSGWHAASCDRKAACSMNLILKSGRFGCIQRQGLAHWLDGRRQYGKQCLVAACRVGESAQGGRRKKNGSETYAGCRCPAKLHWRRRTGASQRTLG